MFLMFYLTKLQALLKPSSRLYLRVLDHMKFTRAKHDGTQGETIAGTLGIRSSRPDIIKNVTS